LFNENCEFIGLVNYWNDITRYNLLDANQFAFELLKEFKSEGNKPFAFSLEKENVKDYS